MKVWGVAGLMLFLGACSDPLAGFGRLSETDVATEDPAAMALPSDQEIAREGFFGTSSAEAEAAVPLPLAQDAPPAPRRGLLGLFRRAAPQDATSNDTDAVVAAVVRDLDLGATPIAAPDPPVELAALPPEPEPVAGTAAARGGIFGIFSARGAAQKPLTGPDAMDVRFRTVLPYGEIARVCEARGRGLGRKIQSAAVRGYKTYDSDPGVDHPRTWYITGFPDGCPRQITAANVLVAAPSLYEQLHYGPAGAHLAYGATDKAYEKIKRRVCGAGRGKPCGAQIGQMDKTTFFITSYARMDENAEWSEILIHDGAVIATALKSAD